jgi:hypothetical protein
LLTISCQKESKDILPKLKGKIKRISYPANSDHDELFFYNANADLSDYKMMVYYLRSCFYTGRTLKEVQYYRARRNDQEPKELTLSKLFYYNGDNILDSIHMASVMDGKRKPIFSFFYEANLKNQIIKTTVVNDDFIPGVTIHDTVFYEHLYNHKGNIVSNLSWTKSETGVRTNGYRFEYTYDDKPNPHQNLSLIDSEPTSPRYQSSNNLTKVTGYNEVGKISYERNHEYDYDTEGKPIKERWHIIFRNGVTVDERGESIIEYY